MKKNFSFFIYLLFVVSIVGCSSQQDKKNAEETPAITTNSQPKNFERVAPPHLMTNTQDRAGYMLEHFWDHFDFRDTMYWVAQENSNRPSVAEQALVDFLSISFLASPDKISHSIKKMLDSAEVDVTMYNYFYKTGEHYLYDPNSPMRNDGLFIPFLEHVITSTKVLEDSKVRPKYQLNLAYRNRVGVKAQDLVYTLNSGATGNLYSIKANYVLLMFYNPDCVQCLQTRNDVKNSTVISEAISSGNLKVLAVYPDEKLDIWKNHLNDIPPTWINGYDKDLAVRTKEIYDLKAIPTLYLLDKDKKVLLKDISVRTIHEYLESVK